MCNEKLEWFKALSTFFAAAAAVVVTGLFAYRQWRLAKAKLSLDLFEKREPIFLAAWKLCSLYSKTMDPVNGPTVSDRSKALVAVINACPNADFLFGKKTGDYLRALAKRAMLADANMSAAQAGRNADPAVKEERHSARQVVAAEVTFMGAQADSCCLAHFAPFLSFERWR